MSIIPVIVLIVAAIMAAIRIFLFFKVIQSRRYFRQFHYNSDLNCFKEAYPKFDLMPTGKKVKHAVLVIHGFASKPGEMNILFDKLKHAALPYYAPLLTGSGLGDMAIFTVVKSSDWLRDAFFAFDLLGTYAEEVSIVAHSTGATIAFHLAQERKVKHLIAIAPNLVIGSSNKFVHKLLTNPFLFNITKFFVPTYVKPIKSNRISSVDTCDPKIAMHSFHYPYIPAKSASAMIKLLESLDLKENFHFKDLTIIYGKHDETVNIKAGLALLEKDKIPFKAYGYDRSAHNVLEDYDREAASDKVIQILKS
jgi:carboxylesterase